MDIQGFSSLAGPDRAPRRCRFRSPAACAAALLAATLLPTASPAVPREETVAALEPYRGAKVIEITLAGNHVTKDVIIVREIWTEVGRPLDPELVADDVIRLENLAIFGSIEATASPEDDGVTLNFLFTEMPWIIPFPAFSYTEENGFSVGLGVASPNFAGRDITLSLSALFGGVTTYRFRADNPWITGNHVSGGIKAWHQTRPNKLLDFAQTTDLAAFTGGMYLGETGRLRAEGGFYGVGSDQPDITLDADGYDSMWYAACGVGLDTRDSWRAPHDGWRNEISVLYGGGAADYWAFDVDVRRFQPLADRHTLATGPLVSFQTGAVGVQIPRYMQYFLGGANSVRGYKLEELGKEFYGQNQLLYTLEYRYLLLPPSPVKVFKWSVGIGFEAAAFADVGVVWSRPEDFNIDRTRSGYGLGLRVLLPSIESLRFDFGVGDRGSLVFNFATNSIFSARRQRAR